MNYQLQDFEYKVIDKEMSTKKSCLKMEIEYVGVVSTGGGSKRRNVL